MNICIEKTVKISRAGAWRTYTGGSLIEALHGNYNYPDSNFPEEWILSRNNDRAHLNEGLIVLIIKATQKKKFSLFYIKPKNDEIIGYENTKLFRLMMHDVNGEEKFMPDGIFCGIYVLGGSGEIDGIKTAAGSQFFISASFKPFTLTGNMKLMIFYGPKEENV